MQDIKNKVVLITGASSGIGEALAREFSKQGSHLALLARRLDKLESLKKELEANGARCVAIKCDVTQEDELKAAVNTIHNSLGKIDIAIANAGYAVNSSMESLAMDDIHRQFDTNVFGVLHTFYAVLPDLKETHGHFVVMGSVAGFISVPQMGVYSMSKYAIRALAEVLHIELEPYGIHTTYVAPGYVESEIHKVDKHGVYHEKAKSHGPKNKMPTNIAAQQIVAAIKKDKKEVVLTKAGKFATLLSRLSPSAMSFLLRHQK